MDLRKQTMRLLDTIGVSGYEKETAEMAAGIMAPFVDEVFVDNIYNVVGYKRSADPNAKTVLLDAHIDQIGYRVSSFTEDGYLRFYSINAPQDMLPGSEVIVLTESGPIRGVCGWKPADYAPDAEHPAARPDFPDLFIDVGLTEKEAREKIAVGDSICFGDGAIELKDGSIMCRASDDRICLMSIIHALYLLKDEQLKVNVVAVGSVKEEFDGSGAFARAEIDKPDFTIAIDVADREPLGGGPIFNVGGDSDKKFADRLIATAQREKIPYIYRVVPQVSGTNGKHFQIAARGACNLGISHPQKFMHTSVEIVSLQDTENIGKLLAEFLKTFDGTL